MSDRLVLYSNPMSRGRIVRWMLEEVGAPYRVEWLDFGTPMRTRAFRTLNPMMKVPVLVHGDQVVTEAAAICMHLADAFPERGLAPPHDRRGAYYRWIAFAAGPLDAAMTNRTLGWDVPEDRRTMVGYGDFDRVIETLEAAVGGAADGAGYLAGPAFSAADVMLGSALIWGMQAGTIPAHPAFETYVSHLAARPAQARAKALDDAALVQMQKEARG